MEQAQSQFLLVMNQGSFGDDSLVNKSYVDAVANGLDVKASVKVATTGNLSGTYNNGNGTITSVQTVQSLLTVLHFL